MDPEFRAGLLSSIVVAGVIVAFTLLAFMEPRVDREIRATGAYEVSTLS